MHATATIEPFSKWRCAKIILPLSSFSERPSYLSDLLKAARLRRRKGGGEFVDGIFSLWMDWRFAPETVFWRHWNAHGVLGRYVPTGSATIKGLDWVQKIFKKKKQFAVSRTFTGVHHSPLQTQSKCPERCVMTKAYNDQFLQLQLLRFVALLL